MAAKKKEKTQKKTCLVTLRVPTGDIKVAHSLGAVADPCDMRDYGFLARCTQVKAAVAWSPEMDLTKYFRPISDQMQFPSCTANATVDCWEAAIIVDKVLNKSQKLEYAIQNTPDLSRMFDWWCGRREMDPDQSWNPDSGCYNRLTVDVLARFGVPREFVWPYIPANATRKPSLTAFRDAYGYVCGNYYSIQGDGQTRKDGLMTALANNHPIIFAAALEDSFLDYTSGVIQTPSSNIIGLHAMVIVGWSDSRKAFRVRNSWSQYWGEGGYCWMAESYIMAPCVNSFWVLTRGYP